MQKKSYLPDNQRDLPGGTVNRRMDRSIRIAWVLLALLTLSTLVKAVKPRIVELQADPYGFGSAYERLGISSDSFAIYFTSIESLFALLFFAVGGLIFWKASRDRMAILVSAAFITMGTATPLPEALIGTDPGWRWTVLLLRVLGIGLMFLFLYLFPDGRFVPRWNRWLGVVAALYLASWFIFPMLIPSMAILAEATDTATVRPYVPLALLTLLGIGGQIFRYYNVSNNLQRQQTKWVLTGIVGFILVEVVSLFLFALTPAARQPGADQLLFIILFGPLLLAGAALIPITTTLAILRYRLWDISFVVRRTLVYTLLTAVLVLIYLSSVTVLQGVFAAVSGQRSAVAIVISTLIIAALFNPLRHRFQDLIDLRFYRRKYDSVRILENFAKVARDEVDLERLEAALVSAVRETMQPEHTSLWLKKIDRGHRPRK